MRKDQRDVLRKFLHEKDALLLALLDDADRTDKKIAAARVAFEAISESQGDTIFEIQKRAKRAIEALDA